MDNVHVDAENSNPEVEGFFIPASYNAPSQWGHTYQGRYYYPTPKSAVLTLRCK